MDMGARVLMCHVVILFFLCWISGAQGYIINGACTDSNCTSTRIGDPCSSQADCLAINSSQCQNDTCQCISGYLSTNESKECRLRTISDKCKTRSECSDVMDNSYCHTDQTCRCLDGYRFDGLNCVARKLDDECLRHSDCNKVMNNTRCSKQMCKCVNRYVKEDDNTCRPRRTTDNCTNNNECNIGGDKFMVCYLNQCQCARGYHQGPNDTMGEPSCVRIKLGSRCSKRIDCLHVAYSKCGKDRTCQCAREDGRRASANNETCEVIQLNEDCLTNADCQNINNSVCVQGNCSCAPGYSQDVIGGFCNAVLLGDPCLTNSDCGLANSFCNSSNICSCMRGFEWLNGSGLCTKMIIEDIKCNAPEDCFEHFPNTNCTSAGRCRCEPQYYLSPNGSHCLLRSMGDSCSNDAECLFSVQFSQCHNHTCQCIQTHLPASDNTNCVLKNLGGLTCETHAECHRLVPHSSCGNNNTCLCNTGYSSNENFDRCLEKRLLEPCLTDAECNLTNAYSFCSNISQICECFPEFVPTFPDGLDSPTAITASKPFCSRRTIGDQSCQTKEECFSAIANSTCASCQDAPEGSPCLQRCRGLPDVTASPDLLHSGSNCGINTCLCVKGFLPSSDGYRCERRKLRESCRTDEDCSVLIPNSVCLTEYGKCFCAPGFRENGSYLCTRYKLGDLCIKASDCGEAVSSSHCNFSSSELPQGYGLCKCNSGYQGNEAGTECRKRQIGDRTCVVPTDCSDAINNSYCQLEMCVCTIGFYRSYDHTQCNKRRLYFDYCDDNPDCNAAIPNAVCERNRCICPSGYTDNGDECKKRNIQAACTLGTDCSDAVGNSTCVGGVCRCLSGFVSVVNETCIRRNIFDDCENLHDCADAVGNSNCRNGTCLCDRGYYPSNGGTVCLRRKLRDACSVASDCLTVIENSNCVMEVCACLEGYDAQVNTSRCVSRPIYIGDPCYFTEQCHSVHPASMCNMTRQNLRCLCPPWTLTAINRTACVKLPTGVGDYCTHNEHCKRVSENSACVNLTCTCLGGYFVDGNKTTCHRHPEKFGDFCQEDEHCNRTMDKSKCELENNTCVCEYGYTQNTAKSCVERDILPQYQPITAPDPAICVKDKCPWTNSRCLPGLADIQCRCEFRHALLFNSTQCVPVQTYQLHLSVISEAGKYDYEPLEFKKEYLSPKLPIFEEFANRITLNGLMKLFNETWSSSLLKDRYVASEVTRFQNLDVTNQATHKGVKATVLLHLTAKYLDATPLDEIYNFIEENLNSSDGLLGTSALKVAAPYSQAVVFRDYDECALSDRNDCSVYATCINTLGSFMCVCKYEKHVDVSRLKNKPPGRFCEVPSNTTEESNESCSTSGCQTGWEFVVLFLVVFLLIVTAFITYEIMQRKKTFTARKLYEKFGTTKIRKLRQASVQRLQERKKRKKEESKTKKEGEKQKNEELRKAKNEKKRLKDEATKMKQEEKKQKDLEKKNGKRAKKGESSDDVEWCGGDEERESSSSAVEAAHPTSSPYPATTDDSPTVEIASLPGSVNIPETEMSFPKMITSHIEESNV